MELLAVVGILAIVTGIAVPLVFEASRRVKLKGIKTDISMTLDTLHDFCVAEEMMALDAGSCRLTNITNGGNWEAWLTY